MAGDQLCLRYILLKNISEINDNNAKFLLNFFPESENENTISKGSSSRACVGRALS